MRHDVSRLESDLAEALALLRKARLAMMEPTGENHDWRCNRAIVDIRALLARIEARDETLIDWDDPSEARECSCGSRTKVRCDLCQKPICTYCWEPEHEHDYRCAPCALLGQDPDHA